MRKKKYKMLKYDSIKKGCHTLYRIKALKNFGNVHKGDLGGYIEKEENLFHEDECWVGDLAEVYGNAKILGNAKISGSATISDNAVVKECATVTDYATVKGNAVVTQYATVKDYAKIYGAATICGHARVEDSAIVRGNSEISGTACIYGYSNLLDVTAMANATVCLDTCNAICNATICGMALIKSLEDCCSISGFGSRYGDTSFYRCADGKIRVKCGCFNGTLKQFKKAVKETHGDNKYAKEYLAMIKIIKKKFKTEQEDQEEEESNE